MDPRVTFRSRTSLSSNLILFQNCGVIHFVVTSDVFLASNNILQLQQLEYQSRGAIVFYAIVVIFSPIYGVC